MLGLLSAVLLAIAPPSGPPATIDALVAVAAADFQAHGPRPIDVRNVRGGTIDRPNAPDQLIVCGEYLAADDYRGRA